MNSEKQAELNKLMGSAINNFLSQIDGHRNSYPVLINSLISNTKIKIRNLNKFLKESGLDSKIDSGEGKLTIPSHLHADFFGKY